MREPRVCPDVLSIKKTVKIFWWICMLRCWLCEDWGDSWWRRWGVGRASICSGARRRESSRWERIIRFGCTVRKSSVGTVASATKRNPFLAQNHSPSLTNKTTPISNINKPYCEPNQAGSIYLSPIDQQYWAVLIWSAFPTFWASKESLYSPPSLLFTYQQ